MNGRAAQKIQHLKNLEPPEAWPLTGNEARAFWKGVFAATGMALKDYANVGQLMEQASYHLQEFQREDLKTYALPKISTK